jgi:hypothetical protein
MYKPLSIFEKVGTVDSGYPPEWAVAYDGRGTPGVAQTKEEYELLNRWRSSTKFQKELWLNKSWLENRERN